MKEARYFSSCTVFEGEIVVTGGRFINSDLFVYGGYLQNGEYDNFLKKFCNLDT